MIKELSYCTSDSDKIKVLKKYIDCLLSEDYKLCPVQKW